MQTHNTGFFTG